MTKEDFLSCRRFTKKGDYGKKFIYREESGALYQEIYGAEYFFATVENIKADGFTLVLFFFPRTRISFKDLQFI